MEGNRIIKADMAPDQAWNRLFFAGGVSGLLTGLLYLAATVMLLVTPMQPTSGGVATLEYIASYRTVYIVEQFLYNAPVVLALVVFLALYFVLKGADRSYAAIGSLFGIVSEGVSLLIFNTVAGLVYLSDAYNTTTDVTQKMVFSSGAEALLSQVNIAFAAGVVTALGILILSLIMLRGIFRKRIAYLGIVTGIFGMIGEAFRTVLGSGYIVYGILLIIWFFVIGWELYKLSMSRSIGPQHDIAP